MVEKMIESILFIEQDRGNEGAIGGRNEPLCDRGAEAFLSSIDKCMRHVFAQNILENELARTFFEIAFIRERNIEDVFS